MVIFDLKQKKLITLKVIYLGISGEIFIKLIETCNPDNPDAIFPSLNYRNIAVFVRMWLTMADQNMKFRLNFNLILNFVDSL